MSKKQELEQSKVWAKNGEALRKNRSLHSG